MPNILPSIEESLTDLDSVLKALDDSAIGEAIPFVDRAIKSRLVRDRNPLLVGLAQFFHDSTCDVVSGL